MSAVARVHATRPNGEQVTFFAADVRLVEARDGRIWVECDDLPDRVELDPAETMRARAQLANLVAARLHDARAAHRILDDAIDSCIALTEIDERGTQ